MRNLLSVNETSLQYFIESRSSYRNIDAIETSMETFNENAIAIEELAYHAMPLATIEDFIPKSITHNILEISENFQENINKYTEDQLNLMRSLGVENITFSLGFEHERPFTDQMIDKIIEVLKTLSLVLGKYDLGILLTVDLPVENLNILFANIKEVMDRLIDYSNINVQLSVYLSNIEENEQLIELFHDCLSIANSVKLNYKITEGIFPTLENSKLWFERLRFQNYSGAVVFSPTAIDDSLESWQSHFSHIDFIIGELKK